MHGGAVCGAGVHSRGALLLTTTCMALRTPRLMARDAAVFPHMRACKLASPLKERQEGRARKNKPGECFAADDDRSATEHQNNDGQGRESEGG